MKKSKYKKGDIFSMLEIVKPYSSQDKQGKWSHTVVCDCGVVKEVRGSSLSSGQTSSCGCYQRLVSTTHGKSKTPEYVAWRAMLTRVDNKNKLGIKIMEEGVSRSMMTGGISKASTGIWETDQRRTIQ